MLSALDRLRISFQADGAFSSRKGSYTGTRTGTVAIRYSLKKDRKKQRLKSILEELPYKFSWEEYSNGYCSVRVKIPLDIFKTFSKKLSDMFDTDKVNVPWCEAFIHEAGHWDGSFNKIRPNNIRYTSTIEENVRLVVDIATLAGYTATFSEYVDKRTDYSRKPIYTSNINIKGNGKTLQG